MLQESYFVIPTELLKQLKPHSRESTETAVAFTRILTHLQLDAPLLTELVRDELVSSSI